jgi:hypothetical protein
VARLDKGDVPTDHVITVEKVRGCTAMDGKQGVNPGPDFWKPLFDWWLSAEALTIPLHHVHAAAIRAAKTLDALKAVFTAVNADVSAGRLSVEQTQLLTALKDERKGQLAGEGEQRADFHPPATTRPAPTAPTSTAKAAPTAAASGPTAAAPASADARPMPGAERRTAEPTSGAWALDTIKLLNELGVSWLAITLRQPGIGRELADAAGIVGEIALTALEMSQRNKLRTAILDRLGDRKGRSA